MKIAYTDGRARGDSESFSDTPIDDPVITIRRIACYIAWIDKIDHLRAQLVASQEEECQSVMYGLQAVSYTMLLEKSLLRICLGLGSAVSIWNQLGAGTFGRNLAVRCVTASPRRVWVEWETSDRLLATGH